MAPDVFQEKGSRGHDLYEQLLENLKPFGPICVTEKAMSISIASQSERAFAWVIIRNRSLKLVFRTHQKIAHERIAYENRAGEKSYDHTVMVGSKSEIDAELMGWLGEAYEETLSR
jgi:predicted transport protein